VHLFTLFNYRRNQYISMNMTSFAPKSANKFRWVSSALALALCVFLPPAVTSFSTNRMMEYHRLKTMQTQLYGSSTVEAPTRPDTDRKTRRNRNNDERGNEERRSGSNWNDDDDDVTNDLEYYQDSSASREMNEPFHILLMGSATFVKPKVTVPYVSQTLEYVLGMPYDDAYELSQFAHDHEMSCLGTWTREQCLSYGKQLQNRDVMCRVVPYCLGGQRGWQAKDASSSSYSNSEQ
jgi:hypothetical protein